MQSLDLLANNLANSATAGFKRDTEYYGLYSSEESSGDTQLPVIEREWTDFSQGTVEASGNPMDVALMGSGFLVVNGSTGPLYTRNGNLQILANGTLATADGYALQDAVTGNAIQLAANKPIEISTGGVITQDGQPVGQLKVVEFKNLKSLTKLGNACFQNTDATNVPVAAQSTQVQQGKIEGSNVPVAEAAMRLVGVMRQFEMLQKAVGISSEMDTKTIQEVARVGS